MSFKGEVGCAVDGYIAGRGCIAGSDVVEIKTADVDAVEVEGGGSRAFEGEGDTWGNWVGKRVGRVGGRVVRFGMGNEAATIDAKRPLVFDADVVVVEVAVFVYSSVCRPVVELGSTG